MYASIRRHHRVAGSVDGLIPEGRRLTSVVSEVPGFVAYALLDTGDGLLVSVSLFDDEPGLAAADRLVQDWIAPRAGTVPAARTDESDESRLTTGEVIVQKGL